MCDRGCARGSARLKAVVKVWVAVELEITEMRIAMEAVTEVRVKAAAVKVTA